MTVASQIFAAQQVLDERLDQALRDAVKLLYNNTIELSPVDTGRYRGSWRIAVNGRGDTAPEPKGSAGNATGAKQFSATTAAENQYRGNRLKAIKAGTDTISVLNNVRYAIYVETGSPTINPRNVLGIAIERTRVLYPGVVANRILGPRSD